MLSVKLLFLDAIIENLTVLLCREDVPVFFDSYLSLLDRLIHARNALRMREPVFVFSMPRLLRRVRFIRPQKTQISMLSAFCPRWIRRIISGCFSQWFFCFPPDFILIAAFAFSGAIAAFLQSFIEMQQ